MQTSRRHFLQRAAACSAGFAGLQSVLAAERSSPPLLQRATSGYGPLRPDPLGLIALPDGFTSQVISRAGETMSDGLLVPGKHDGMGAMPGPDGLTIIVRNHEISPGHVTVGPFDAVATDTGIPDGIDQARIFDPGTKEGPFAGPSRGGCTTLVYDTKSGNGDGELRTHALSLVGTEHNCAGGITPRNTWITCEESVTGPADELGRTRLHGWCFEVPATVHPELVDPRPIKPMGRFNHEAVAVDPGTGIVYMTEDRNDGVLFRYLPSDPADLHSGGPLQALAIAGTPQADLRNWNDAPTVSPGDSFETTWIDVDDIESPDDSLRYQAFDKGAARFARGEGMWFGEGSVYFACTTGGTARHGQIWRYVIPSSQGNGTDQSRGGTLHLFIEPNDASIIEHADNLTIAPWGDLIVCEDGLEEQYLLGVTPDGAVYKFGLNLMNQSEFAGATFSPDGTTLFVNIQNPGLTLAITGPWESRRA